MAVTNGIAVTIRIAVTNNQIAVIVQMAATIGIPVTIRIAIIALRVFLFQIVSPVTFAPVLYTNLCVVAATLLAMAKSHAILLLIVERWELRKRENALQAFLHPLGNILTSPVIVLPLTTFVFKIKPTMNWICLYTESLLILTDRSKPTLQKSLSTCFPSLI